MPVRIVGAKIPVMAEGPAAEPPKPERPAGDFAGDGLVQDRALSIPGHVTSGERTGRPDVQER